MHGALIEDIGAQDQVILCGMLPTAPVGKKLLGRAQVILFGIVRRQDKQIGVMVGLPDGGP